MNRSVLTLALGLAAVPASAGQRAFFAPRVAPAVAPVAGASAAMPQIPATALPAAVSADGSQPAKSAAEAMQRLGAQLILMSEKPSASADGSREDGDKLQQAMTGEGSSGSGAPVAPNPQLQDEVKKAKKTIDDVMAQLDKVIVGQKEMKKALIMGRILTAGSPGGHVLLEGLPGVAKTETAKALADAVDGRFQRVQGTPDKLPSDITGLEVIETDPRTGEKKYVAKKGPIFTDVLLADEINRMMPKTQSSLLEAMGERSTTIGLQTYNPKTTGDFDNFFVIGTQNPVEQDGTYRLPEAQQDRFMFKVNVQLPDEDEMIGIVKINRSHAQRPQATKVTTLQELAKIRDLSERLTIDDSITRYAVQVAMAASRMPEVSQQVQYTVYVRAGIFLERAARLHAVLEGRDFVSPADVKAVAPLVLRHRIVASFGSDRDAVERIIEKILGSVPEPRSGPAAEAAAPAQQQPAPAKSPAKKKGWFGRDSGPGRG